MTLLEAISLYIYLTRNTSRGDKDRVRRFEFHSLCPSILFWAFQPRRLKSFSRKSMWNSRTRVSPIKLVILFLSLSLSLSRSNLATYTRMHSCINESVFKISQPFLDSAALVPATDVKETAERKKSLLRK